jgi:hypothetical protein
MSTVVTHSVIVHLLQIRHDWMVQALERLKSYKGMSRKRHDHRGNKNLVRKFFYQLLKVLNCKTIEDPYFFFKSKLWVREQTKNACAWYVYYTNLLEIAVKPVAKSFLFAAGSNVWCLISVYNPYILFLKSLSAYLVTLE